MQQLAKKKTKQFQLEDKQLEDKRRNRLEAEKARSEAERGVDHAAVAGLEGGNVPTEGGASDACTNAGNR